MSNTVKQGDTHSITLTVYDTVAGTPTPLNLTGATVRLLAKLGADALIILTASINADPATGKVHHTLTGTLEPGTYNIEVEVTQGGTITTAPTTGFATLVVTPDLR